MEEPTLRELAEGTLKWIFVGGKGGVGKTTTSCSLATLLASRPVKDPETGAERQRRVLLISTDPAHNLSDAFNQQFGKEPTLVNGTTNLFAMESDPSTLAAKGNPFLDELSAAAADKNSSSSAVAAEGSGAATAANQDSAAGSSSSPLKDIMKSLGDTMKSLPGVDELSVFSFILRDERIRSFDVVVFDTAPTGHTLRLLAMPQTIGTTMDKVNSGGEALGNLLQMAGQLVSVATGVGQNTLAEKLKQWREDIRTVQSQFQDESKTAFVCVCIPEFLSLYETDRLIQELTKYRIQCNHVVVNQLVLRPSGEAPCRMCGARQKIQGKYLSQIHELYGEDFHVVKMPLHGDEVRGLPMLQKFAKFLLEPYEVEKHGYL